MEGFSQVHQYHLKELDSYLAENLGYIPDLVAKQNIDQLDKLIRLLDEFKIGLLFEQSEESQYAMTNVMKAYQRYDIKRLKNLIKATETSTRTSSHLLPNPENSDNESSGYDSDETISVGEGVARVLLYCHGNIFKVGKSLQDKIEKSCELIGMRDPGFYESVNTNQETNPTILSDGRLKRIFFNEFNVVIDVDCDYSGWATSPEQFIEYTIPRYIDMVSALHRDRWGFVIALPNPSGFFSQRMRTFNEENIRAIELILGNKYRRFGKHEYDYVKGGVFGKIFIYHS